MIQHCLRSQDWSRPTLEQMFAVTDRYKKSPIGNLANNKIMCSLFYEPSTRTRLSFESAWLRLGGQVIGTDNAGEFSSAIKGESLEDSIRVISGYTDLIVLRHGLNNAAERAAAVSAVPIINAGCGAGQHPTQSLTDLYTIQNRLGRIDDIKVAIVGDLQYGRTARSLAYLLTKFENITIYFVSTPSLQIGADITDYLASKSVKFYMMDSLEGVLEKVDVVYQTRFQKERHEFSTDGYADLSLTVDRAMHLKEHAIILHPLPRNYEIAVEVDALRNAAYFEQAKNSLYVRMALLDSMLG